MSVERAHLANAGEFNRRYLTCQVLAILYADRGDRRIKSPSVSPALNSTFPRLRVKLKSFPAFGARLWNCLHPDWRKLTKRAFKRKLHKLLLTVLGIEDYYVDAHSLILKINANNYCTL